MLSPHLPHWAAVRHLLKHTLRIVAGIRLQVQINQQQHLLAQGGGSLTELGEGAQDQDLDELVWSQGSVVSAPGLILQMVVEDGFLGWVHPLELQLPVLMNHSTSQKKPEKSKGMAGNRAMSPNETEQIPWSEAYTLGKASANP